MTDGPVWAGREGRQSLVLLGFLLVQSLAAVFFVGDVAYDLLHEPRSSHTIYEAIVVLALLLGVAFGALALRQTLGQLQRQSQALQTAQGAMSQVLARQFVAWGLTPAEADVALLALKGLDGSEIAAVRASAPGTIRAHLARVYAKAGVSNRAQFAALFVEDLLSGPLATPSPAASASPRPE